MRSTALQRSELSCVVLRCVLMCSVVLFYVVLCCVALCCVALHLRLRLRCVVTTPNAMIALFMVLHYN